MIIRILVFSLWALLLLIGPYWRGLLPTPELKPDFYETRSWATKNKKFIFLRIHARRHVLEQLEVDPNRREAMADKLVKEIAQ